MNKLLLLSMLAALITPVHSQQLIRSEKRHVSVLINGGKTDWTISPDINPDRLKVYCAKARNEVVFQTNSDTAKFFVSNRDTIRFCIILKSKDTARTEIVGIRDLPDKITVTEKLYWLSQVWSETKYNFINIDKLDFNPDSLYRSFIPKVLNTKNDYEYYRMLKKFMACFHDGHTAVVDEGQFYLYTDYIPIMLEDFNKKVYITSVRKIPELDSTWMGAELIRVEGVPTTRYLEENIFPYIPASTEQHRWMQGAFNLNSGLRDKPFRGTIRKTDGNILDIILQRNGEATRTPNDQYWGPKYTYPHDIVEMKWLENGIAYVNFSAFYPEERAIREFDSIAPELRKAKAIIIDLRQNGGGSTVVSQHLQMYFTPGKYFLNFGWQTRTNDGVGKANGNWIAEYKDYYLNRAIRFVKPDTVPVPDTLKRIICPTVILIGRYTFSAAEDFLVNIYEVPGRPLFIGAETGGSTGSPLVVDGLPGGGYARICTRRICFPYSSKPFVNSGIRPDIEVQTTITDYLRQKDMVLERAISELKTKQN